jgi:hypothetical protein
MPTFRETHGARDFRRKEVAVNAFRRQRAKDRIDLLPPEPDRQGRRPAPRQAARLDVVDADFVVIGSGPTRTSPARTSNDNHRPLRPATTTKTVPPHALLRAAGKGARLFEAGLQLLPRRAFAGLVAASFIFVFAYAGGLSALMAALPASTPGQPLRVSDISATVDDRNGMKILSVYGRIDNVGDGVETLPPVHVRLEGTGETHRRSVVLDAASLAPGTSEHFSLRIPHEGGKVPKVSVSLAP